MEMPVANARRFDNVASQILCDRYKKTSIGDYITTNTDDSKDSLGLNKLFNEDTQEDHESDQEKEIKDLSLLTFKNFLKKNLHKKRIKSDNIFVDEKISSLDEVKDIKKVKKKKTASICLANCRYGVIRRIAKQFGMREVDEVEQWNIYWTDLSVSVERAKEMKRFQKVNHFPGMSEICRKDLLARNLNRMLKMFPKDYNFFPKTWCIPADLGEVFAYAKAHPTRTFIMKPDLGCQGKGIFLTKNLKELRNVKAYDRMICQVYISKPFLVDGFKFDMRVYTLITSVDPLRIFVYNDGLARFATSRYKEPAGHNTTNLYMHLTNYAVNKHSRTYVVDDEAGSKRRLSTINQNLCKMNEDVDKVWESIDDIIIKTVIAAHPILKHSYNTCFSNHDLMYACFEILGFDIILDHKLKPYILEVNHSPSFHTDASLDKDVKESLLTDTFSLLNLPHCYKKKALDQDKQRVRNRLLQPLNPHANRPDYSSLSTEGIADKLSKKIEEWELNHLGNYRLIFPNANSEKYQLFFQQNQCSIFQETFASRAREEARRIEKEQYEAKMKEELGRRIGGKEKDKEKKRLGSAPESPTHIIRPKLPSLKKHLQKSLCSFEPNRIEDIEESKRVAAMMQRDYLVRSFGLMEHVYKMMKVGGNLRISDVIKYGVFDKSGNIESVSTDNNGARISSLMKILPQINSKARSASVRGYPIKCTVLEPPWQRGKGNDNQIHNGKCSSNSDDNNNMYDSIGCISIHNRLNEKITKNNNDINYCKPNLAAEQVNLPELAVTCNEAAMWTRPNLPKASEWPHKLRAKSTKTFIARHFSNTLKLQDLELRMNGDHDMKAESNSAM